MFLFTQMNLGMRYYRFTSILRFSSSSFLALSKGKGCQNSRKEGEGTGPKRLRKEQ